ncbi:MAG: hypothetical protein F6K22_03660 [Okeania sp. SIO2F4]|uniref:hypothetical protein n=1 Tax=Okeania sp. SIO2F4 TaxID=2607790 RepID=UPI00142CF426|nr:hypothetical protein [Okeania sp. SIO2F4]NES02001.1 hypothetical protein [Okeania sp. SIO2F4]
MTKVTPEEFEDFRSQLGEASEVKESLSILENNLEECDWILEDATTLIAVDFEESVLMGDSLLEDLVERARKHLCKPEIEKGWDDLKDVLELVKELLPTPAPLVMACVFKLWEIGLKNLCKNE